MSDTVYKPSETTTPEFPNFCPEDRPVMGRPKMCYPPVPPAPSVVSGMDLYEAMNNLSDRVNLCINNYNSVMAESYKTLHNLQRAAQENGAYYGSDEVWVEEGYYADESATYHLVHKACVDRRGEPIRMKLHLAYGNTTNSKIEQEMFNASKVEFADKMFVAIPKTENGWYGKAIWNNCPIGSYDEPNLYTVGFTQGGVMRVYNNGVDVNQMIRDTVVDAMGCSGVLIQNGQLTDDSYRVNIPNADKQVARVVMGQNVTTKEVVILTVGNENDVNRKGMTSAACAKVLLDYGCDIAVEICEGADAGAMDKGSLMFVPDEKKVPSVYAYWYISRKKFYTTDYERELAELVQNYGACIWQGFLNKINIEGVKAELDEEVERALNAEKVLQENIDKETDRAEKAETVLQENIDKETARAEEAEKVLTDNLNAEISRATGEEERIEGRLDEEITRAKGEEVRIEGKLDTEIQRAKDAEQVLTDGLNAEISRAKAAEKVLTDDLDTEVHDRTNEDAKLHQEILTEQGARVSADETLQSNINKEASARANQDTILQGNIDALATRVSACESNISQLQTLTNSLQEEVSSLDASVTSMQGTVASIQTSLNNLTTSVTTLSADVQELSKDYESLNNELTTLSGKVTAIEGEIGDLPYLKLTGGNLSGDLGVKGQIAASASGISLNDDGTNVTTNYGEIVGKADGVSLSMNNGITIKATSDSVIVENSSGELSKISDNIVFGIKEGKENTLKIGRRKSDGAGVFSISKDAYIQNANNEYIGFAVGDATLNNYPKSKSDSYYYESILAVNSNTIWGSLYFIPTWFSPMISPYIETVNATSAVFQTNSLYSNAGIYTYKVKLDNPVGTSSYSVMYVKYQGKDAFFTRDSDDYTLNVYLPTSASLTLSDLIIGIRSTSAVVTAIKDFYTNL